MYWRRFNLTGEPFSLTPDPAFLYLSSIHAEAYAALTMGLKERRGLISMIGEVGTGKTTLVYSLLSTVGPEIHTAYISNARLSFDGILRSALRDFGVRGDNLHGVDLLDAFNEFLQGCARQGTTAALVIDEAQNLSHDTFEDLRLLSNFETYKHKLLQIVLVGQPELDSKLRDPALRQVAERIAVRCHVNPLTAQETRHYIDHRLSAVGGSSDIFTETALRTIISRSAGIPRAVNILCHNAMLFAYGQAKSKVTRAMVLEAVHEKEGVGLVRTGSSLPRLPAMQRWSLESATWAWNAAVLILAVGVSVALVRAAGNIRFTPPVLEPVATPALPAATSATAAAAPTFATRQREASADTAAPQRTQPDLDTTDSKTDSKVEQATVADVGAALSGQAVAERPVLAEKPPAIPQPQADTEAPAPAPPVSQPEADQRERAAADPQPLPPSAAAPIAAAVATEPPAVVPDTVMLQRSESADEHASATPPEARTKTTAVVTRLNDFARPDSAREQRSGIGDEASPYKIVDVEPGNSLSDLMIAVYGQYTNNMVRRVQALNPQITDPNMILAGDSLRFPADSKPRYESEGQPR